MFNHICLSFLVFSIVCISFGTSSDLSDEAWENYRSSLRHALSLDSQRHSPGSDIALVTTPHSREEFMQKLNLPCVSKDGVYETVVGEDVCSRWSSLLMKQGTPAMFVDFKRKTCKFQPLSSKRYNANSFTIKGTSLVNGGTGAVHHQRQSFITEDGQHEVKVNALNRLGALGECKPSRMSDSEWNRKKRTALIEHIKIIFYNDDDINEDDDTALVNHIYQNIEQAFNEDQQETLQQCVSKKWGELLSAGFTSSLKEFELNFKLNSIEIVNVENEAFDSTVAKRIHYGLIPKQLVVVHQPRVVMSLSRKDMGKFQQAYEKHKSLVVGGMRFDRMNIVKNGDDDEDLYYRGSVDGFIRYFNGQIKCTQGCINKYSDQTDNIVYQDLQMMNCACRCYGGKKCEGSTHQFQVELSSSGTQVLAVIGNDY